MSPTTTAAAFISALLLLSSASALNITAILNQYPADFGTFNGLLTATGLADEINGRKTITVLALTNDRLGDLAGKSVDVQKRILSTHVVLDYFDVLKLTKLGDSKTVITTLYQSTGTADDMQGFLDVVHRPDGGIYFGSAMKGAPIDARLVGSVYKQPYNVSVLSISHVIVAPGIDGTMRPVTAPAAKAPAPAVAKEVPPPSESPEEEAEEPAAADAPAPADADAPSDVLSPAPAPDSAPADADQPKTARNAAGTKVVSGASVGLAVALASFLAVLH